MKESELEDLMLILEEASDEVLAAKLLKELNESTKILGRLILNQDSSLSNEAWKVECDRAKKTVDSIIQKIRILAT